MAGPKIERTEDRQLPRWVYALMASKADPDDPEVFDDSPKLRGENQVKATTFYKIRQERLREMDMQNTSSRRTGLEWQYKPRSTFTKQELDKIIPTRRASYVVAKTGLVSIIAICVLLGTAGMACIVAAVCAEIKLHGSAGEALTMLATDPGGYVHRVSNALGSNGDDN